MIRPTRGKLAAAAAAVLALAGGGAAIAATASHGSAPAATAHPASYVRSQDSPPAMFPGGRHGPSDELEAAAAYLGVTTAQLQSDLQSGKTLAQIANATAGKSADGLIQALVDAETKEFDAAVAAGRLTKAQEDAILPTLKQRFTDLVNGTFRGHRFGSGDSKTG